MDAQDNLLTLSSAFGENTTGEAARRWQWALSTFYAQLESLIAQSFAPPEFGFRRAGAEQYVSMDAGVRAELGLSDLTLRAVEMYLERWGEALAFMRSAAPRVLQAAREVEVRQYFSGEHIVAGRKGEAPFIRVPQGKSHEVVAYAKTGARVRFECRYSRNVATTLGPVSNGSQGRLLSLFEAAAAHAAPRLGLFISAIRQHAQEHHATVLPRAEATARLSALVFRAAEDAECLDDAEGILARLIADGGVSLPSTQGAPTAALVAALERLGAVERSRFQMRESGAYGRRWRVVRELEEACI